MARWQQFLLAPTLFSMSLGLAYGGWQEVERRDIYRVVIIDRADIKKVPVYWEALRKVCGEGYCNVAFFDRRTALPQPGQRLTDDHLNQALMIYTSNKGFTWNCELRPDADNCFRR